MISPDQNAHPCGICQAAHPIYGCGVTVSRWKWQVLGLDSGLLAFAQPPSWSCPPPRWHSNAASAFHPCFNLALLVNYFYSSRLSLQEALKIFSCFLRFSFAVLLLRFLPFTTFSVLQLSVLLRGSGLFTVLRFYGFAVFTFYSSVGLCNLYAFYNLYGLQLLWFCNFYGFSISYGFCNFLWVCNFL